MKNIKIIAGMLLLALCSSKAVSSDGLSSKIIMACLGNNFSCTIETTFGSDINGRYSLFFPENWLAAIALLPEPGKVEIKADLRLPDGRTFPVKDGGIIRKSRIDGALALFSERIKSHKDIQQVTIFGIQEPGVMDIEELIPDKDIIKECYFKVNPTLERIQIMRLNNFETSYFIEKNGKLIKYKPESREPWVVLRTLW